MKKIIVIGSGGAGKSTFSKHLGDILGLDVIQLDELYWQRNWTEMSRAEWVKTMEKLVARDSWIMDGNYSGTLSIRMNACDTVIFLDLPRVTCLTRVVKRIWNHYGHNRPEMAAGCPEKFDLEFLLWVWNFPAKTKPEILSQIEQFPDKKIFVLHSQREVENFIEHQG